MRLSASGVHHAKECAWIYRSDAPIFPDGHNGRASKTGTFIHELIAHYLNPHFLVGSNSGVDLNRAYKLFEAWKLWWSSFHGRRRFTPEVALSYNPLTHQAKKLRVSGARDYSNASPDSIVGTADAISLVDYSKHGRHAVVLDWKTSIYGGLFMEPAKTNSQLATLALAAHVLYEVRKVRVFLVHLSSKVEVDEAWLEESDFEEHRRLLTSIQWDISCRLARPQPCNKCHFCPANRPKACPAMGFDWPDLLNPAKLA